MKLSVELALPTPGSPKDFKNVARMIRAQCLMFASDPSDRVTFHAGSWRVTCDRTRQACEALADRIEKGVPRLGGFMGQGGAASDNHADRWRRECPRIAPWDYSNIRTATGKQRERIERDLQECVL